MTGIVQHTCRRIGWNQSRHTYLIDVGHRIGVPLVLTVPGAEGRILAPPHPETRYFEVEIDEVRGEDGKIFVFQHIVPVTAGRKRDWYFLKFRIRRGGWTITERIHGRIDEGESQWIYTDDFDILFLSSGGRHDLEMLIRLITTRLDEIAASILSGAPQASQLENQQACRDSLDSLFSDGVDGAFRETVLYRDHVSPVNPGVTGGGEPVSGTGIRQAHGRAATGVSPEADRGLDLDQIEELEDLSWLYE